MLSELTLTHQSSAGILAQSTVSAKSTVRALHVLVATEEHTLNNTTRLYDGSVGWQRMGGGWRYSDNTAQGAGDAIRTVRSSSALQSSTKYHWRVCLTLQTQTTCSEPHSFVTGLISNSAGVFSSEWQAKWIGGNSSTYPTPCTHCMAGCVKRECVKSVNK